MCTYLRESCGQRTCNHTRDYDPVIRNINLPNGIELCDEGFVDETINYTEEIQVTNYICHEKSESVNKVISGSTSRNNRRRI